METVETVEISKKTDETLEFILSVSDMSSESKALSKADVVAIAVDMYRLACMTPLMSQMALDVWAIARNHYNETK